MNRKVKVFKLTRKGNELLHSGVVVGETTTMLRVYKAQGDDRDVSPQTSEWFAKSSTIIHCEYE